MGMNDVKSGEISLQTVLNAAFKFVCEYAETFGEDVPLRIISQRYGKMFRRFNLLTGDALKYDSRFVVSGLNETGGRKVSAIGMDQLEQDILIFLENSGGSALVEDLKAALRGIDPGIKLSDYTYAMNRLVRAGLIVNEGERILLRSNPDTV